MCCFMFSSLQAFKQGFYGGHIIFSFANWIETDWKISPTGCTVDEMLEVISYALFMDSDLSNTNQSIPSISGWTNEEFDKRYMEYFGGVVMLGNGYRNPYYDMTWAAALSLNATMTKLQASGFLEIIYFHTPSNSPSDYHSIVFVVQDLGRGWRTLIILMLKWLI